MNFLTARRKTVAGVAGLMLLTAPLAACGNEEESSSDSGSGSSSESSSTERVEAQATVNNLTGGKTTSIALDGDFVAALEQLGLTPGTVGNASLTNDGELIFDITGGWVQLFEPGSVPNYVVGQIQHEGSGLTLEAGGTEVTIGNLNVDPGRSIVYGDVAADDMPVGYSLPLFDLDGSTLEPVQMSGTEVTLTGTQVNLTQAAADLLNTTYDVDALTDDTLIGVATITVETDTE